MTLHGWEFLVRKSDPRTHVVREVEIDNALADREVALRVEAFALTANTLTYAATGDSLGYWRFYPTDSQDWGRIPAWGYAEVIASAHPDVAVGERLFGYVPMSTHVRMVAAQVRPGALMDASPHRRALPPAYNFYRRSGTASAPLSDDEALRAVLDPLFFTSFLIDDLAAERGWDRIAITSASSKTALGTAFLLHARRVRVVGLTSARNRAFVEQLGVYDEVVTYDDPVITGDGIAVIDFAGDAALLARIEASLGARLAQVLHVGATHASAAGDFALPAGAGVHQGFFAPERILERSKQWGAAELDARHEAAWQGFLPYARGAIRLERGRGREALVARYDELATNAMAPDRGCFLEP